VATAGTNTEQMTLSSTALTVTPAITASGGITGSVTSSNATITGGTITGITDIAIADGGTGASTAAAARTNLGLEIGVDVQAYDAELQALSGLTPTDSNIIVGNGSTFVTESGATARTSLGLGSIATQSASAVSITGGSLTGMTSYSGGTISGTTGTFSGDLAVDTDTLFVDASADRVGINTSSPQAPLNAVSAYSSGTTTTSLKLATVGGYDSGSGTSIDFGQDQSNYSTWLTGKIASPRTGTNWGGSLVFYTNDNSAATGIVERLRLNHDGNMGLGVTPSAWGGSFKALQVNDSVFYNNNSGDTFVGSNYYYDGTNNKYINTDYSAAYGQQAGAHIFYTAPSGTAGNTVTFTQAMTLTSAGLLGISTSSPSTLLQLNEDYGTAALSISDDSSAGDYLTFQIVGGQYNGGANEIQAINTTDLSLNVATARSLIFKTSNTERARIDSSGNLLVGGTSQSGTANRAAVFSANKFGLSIIDTTAQAAGVGGALNLGGNYRSAGDAQAFARIEAVKENGTDANYAYGMAFSTTPNGGTFTERVRILSSGGITFNGDTATANALDDYEEGTITPTLTPSTSGSITTGNNRVTLQYTKIGNVVHIQGFLEVTSVSSPVGVIQVPTGFTPAGTQTSDYTAGTCIVSSSTNSLNANQYTIIANEAYTYLQIFATDGIQFGSDAAQSIGSAADIYINITYIVA